MPSIGVTKGVDSPSEVIEGVLEVESAAEDGGELSMVIAVEGSDITAWELTMTKTPPWLL
jgi:hypothetical protein